MMISSSFGVWAQSEKEQIKSTRVRRLTLPALRYSIEQFFGALSFIKDDFIPDIKLS
jgi:hypothetical protein